MEPNELKKLDQIPTSNKPWYFRTPFFGIIFFVIIIIYQIIEKYLKS
jgi:hypothetical protein